MAYLEFRINQEDETWDPMEMTLRSMRDRCSFLIDAYDNKDRTEVFHQLAALRREQDRASEFWAQIEGQRNE